MLSLMISQVCIGMLSGGGKELACASSDRVVVGSEQCLDQLLYGEFFWRRFRQDRLGGVRLFLALHNQTLAPSLVKANQAQVMP